MKKFHFHTEQKLNVSLTEAWSFFTSPGNLALITPPELDFKIVSDIEEGTIYPGKEIIYIVKPLFGIPFRWKTLINNVIEHHQFTDSQIEGPYKVWEHTHTFTETADGLLMTDVVNYQLPFGILGKFANWIFVQEKIAEIFNYRRETLEKLFNRNGKLVV